MKIARTLAAACLCGLLSATAAYADDCSGRDHTTGTVLGAAGGAAIGGVATHNAGGAIAGAVVGGLAGNAISRSEDCNRNQPADGNYERRDDRSSRDDRGSSVSYYGQGYSVAPDENDYWGVESYADFSADYRHISESIDRARERGSLTNFEARRFSRRLQQIQFRAQNQERNGRFNPQEIEYQLGQLRDDMRSARRNNRDENNSGNYDRR